MPRTGVAACLLWAVLAVVWFVLGARTGVATALAQLPIIALVSTVVYAVLARPRVLVGPRKVVLRNIIRDVYVPYPALSRLDTQYALTLQTLDGRRYQAWAAPAGGRFGAARVTREEQRTLSWSGPINEIPASAGLRSDAGAAAVAIRRRWQPSTEGVEPDRTTATATVRWAIGPLSWLVVSSLAVVLQALL